MIDWLKRIFKKDNPDKLFYSGITGGTDFEILSRAFELKYKDMITTFGTESKAIDYYSVVQDMGILDINNLYASKIRYNFYC